MAWENQPGMALVAEKTWQNPKKDMRMGKKQNKKNKILGKTTFDYPVSAAG